MAENTSQQKSNGQGAVQVVAPSGAENTREKSPNGQGVGNLQVNDSLRIADKIDELLKKLAEDPAFPTLEDMIDFEDKVDSDPAFVGTILQEMPKSMQEDLFSKGSSLKWLDAFFSNSTLDIDKYQFVLQLSYRRRDPAGKRWQDFLISLWRLGDDLTDFMKSIEQRDALGILSWMPSRISIPTARDAFPGGWGILLKADFKPPQLPEKPLLALMEKANLRKPLNSPEMLVRYRHERGLLNFLRICSLEEERDIYRASKNDTGIHQLRPPFFSVFDGSPEDLKRIADQISGQDWGRALFNVDRAIRSKVTQFFNDSKNYQMIETLKQCDHGGTTMEEVGLLREKIARIFLKNAQNSANFRKEKEEKSKNMDIASSEGNSNANAA